MRHRWKNRHQREPADLNITSFMNLMVILVPFLLITAVFSRMAIVELNLPTSSSAPIEEPPGLALEVIVREDAVEVGDRQAGLLTRLPNKEDGYDFEGLADYLKRVKATYPDHVDATLLLEPEVAYDVLVQVIDAVRSYPAVEAGQLVNAELFPEIAIGDAPVRAQEG